MKLLMFIPSLHAGGAERIAARLAGHWAERGWRVILITIEPVASDHYLLHPAVTRVSLSEKTAVPGLFRAMGRSVTRTLRLRRLLQQERPQVALGMMISANILLALASAGLGGVRRVGSERTYPPRVPLGWLWRWLRARLYGWLDAVVVLTEEGRTWILRHTSAREVRVIPNPVAWPLESQSPVRSPSMVGQPNHKRLLTVGRLGPEKRYGLLIEVFAGLAPGLPDWELVILGDGPMRGELEGMVRERGLEARIFLPGHAGNVGDWYESADLYTLTSTFEGFPNALAEAMAYGLPAVSFDIETGPRDIIREGKDGLLVPAGDSDALGRALRLLMSDDAMRTAFGGRAADVRSRFAMEQVSPLWDRIFGLAA